MMKKSESEDDTMLLYYNYIKLILSINHNLLCESPDIKIIKKFLEEIDALHQKLADKYLYKISKRLKYILAETVYNRQKHFLKFILKNKFNFVIDNETVGTVFSSNFDEILENKNLNNLESLIKTEKKEYGLEEIINEELLIEGFYSNILKHKSMYNSNEINQEYILKVSRDLGSIYFLDHFFIWFEEYFDKHVKTMKGLMSKDGFIPKIWRCYIAIMAVSTVKSEYMFKSLEDSFLEEGGDPSWLIYGLDVIPEKLSKLSRINSLLSHQPWKILPEDIKDLTTKRDQNDSTAWNLGELIQATLIMIQFHKLAIISDALNLKLSKKSKFSPIQNVKNKEENLNNDKNLIKDLILKNLEYINKEESISFSNEDNIILDKKDNQSITKSGCSEENTERENSLDLESLKLDPTIDFDKHINKICNIYIDFDAHSDEFRSYLEFNWNDHGYYILHNLFPNGIDCLNAEIDYILTLTTNSLGEENSKLNTFPIRYAISSYIEKILGYIHEDYDYSNVNKLLVVDYKKFIKKLACYPKKLTREDFKMMKYAFNNEEILHIILLVAVVKSRTQLTYLASSLYEIIKKID